MSNQDTIALTRTIVGVARDVRQSPTDEELADVYVPMLQTSGRFAAIVVRTNVAAPSWLAQLRETVRNVDPEIAVGSVQALDATVQQQLARPRFLVGLFAAFGGFAATLGIIGLYAVVAYAVKQREHEIAIRMAVGAEARQIVTMFLREGSGVVLGGIALGLLGAVGVGRLIQAQLFGVRPTTSRHSSECRCCWLARRRRRSGCPRDAPVAPTRSLRSRRSEVTGQSQGSESGL